jgi:hypothetical protein
VSVTLNLLCLGPKKRWLLKSLHPHNVLYIVDNKKNLVFGSLLSKNDFKMLFESDIYSLWVEFLQEKGYFSDNFFKMNIIIIVTNDNDNNNDNNNNNNNNNNAHSSYLFEPYIRCVTW